MKYTKMLGLLSVTAAAFMAFAGTASADQVTSPTGTTYTSTLKAEAEGHVVLDNPIAKIECPSALEGKVENHGEGKAVSGNISSLSFNNCTDSWHVTVVAAGSLSVNGTTGTYNGDVFSTGATVETTRFGISCRYATNNTTIGTLVGGSTATINLSASIPFHSGSVFCGSGATSWTGSYIINTPDSLYVEKQGGGN
jgi:hypothetical protein